MNGERILRRLLVPRVPTHEATSAHLRGVLPFQASHALGGRGAYLGRDTSGAAFCFDAFQAVADGVISGPGMLVLGEIGRGKSSFAKSLVWRQAGVFGRRAVIVSPKRGEYDRLCEAFGTEPVRLRPGGTLRINPLATGAAGWRREPRVASERVMRALRGVAAATLDRPLASCEDAALAATLRVLSNRATLPGVVSLLLDPPEDAWTGRWRSRDEWLSETRDLSLSLDRLVAGDAAGMFDGETSASIDLTAPLVVIDLSEVADSAAIAILMTATLGWIHAQIAAESDHDHAKRIVVCDEAWRVLASLAAAEALLDLTKHSRAYGVWPITITHRIADLQASADAGSRHSRIAEGLLGDAETRVCFAQPDDQIEVARERLGLTDAEVELLPRLRRGEALWRVGATRHLVRHELSAREQVFCETNQRMTSGAGS